MDSIEGAGSNTLAGADAPVLIYQHKLAVVTHCACRADRLTAGVGAMHTTLLEEQPLDLVALRFLSELDPGPSYAGQLRRVLVAALFAVS
jgi:hypothetical protein